MLYAIHWREEDNKGGRLVEVTNLPADNFEQAKEKAIHLFDMLGVTRKANRIELHEAGTSKPLWCYP